MDEMDDADETAQLDDLLRTAVGCALSSTDFAVALDSFRRMLPTAVPDMFSRFPADEAARRAITYAMLRNVWAQLPRPDNDWRPLPLAKPERNGPCPCGSGKKFKQCCAQSDIPPFGDGLSVLCYVLERMPRTHYKNLPFKKLDPEEVGHVARQWLEEGRYDEAAALLEPLLADAAKLDQRHEFAFDVLCDVYLNRGNPKLRAKLVERLMAAPDRRLRSAAMHRRCTMLADGGDYAEAWQVFKEAQRVEPDNPGLSNLEIVLLVSQGKLAEAQERARFWAARLRRLGYGGESIVELMDEVAADPSYFSRAFERGMPDDGDDDEDGAWEEAASRLEGIVKALPPVACRYRLQPADGDAGPLQADTELAGIEDAWESVFPGDADAGEDPWLDTGWIDWLEKHPSAWQSLFVLRDIVMAVDALVCDDDDTCNWLDGMTDVLLERALALLRANIAVAAAENCRLEWGWLENRPALTLVARAAMAARDVGTRLSLLEWLVLTLNPNDNQGQREILAHTYIEAGRPADTLALWARYPDDAYGAMLYGRVLALYRLDRRSEAVAALVEAKRISPRILATLTAARPRMPAELTPGIVTWGGVDEAWYYRQNWLHVWQEAGALDWLKATAGKR